MDARTVFLIVPLFLAGCQWPKERKMSIAAVEDARLLKLVPYEDPGLRKATQRVHFPLSPADQAIIEAMKYSIQGEQLRKAGAPWNAAVGMAANQWGIHKRIFLFCPEGDTLDGLAVIINPRYEPLTHNKDSTAEKPATHQPSQASQSLPQDTCWEGCFSVPLATGNVQRYTQIRVYYQDETGQAHSRILRGWPARVWQHENDHLDGFLYDDPRTAKCLEKHSFDCKEDLEAFYKLKKEEAIKAGQRAPAKAALSQRPCPCGKLQSYQACCGAYLETQRYPTSPEALMRSRYTAYTMNNLDYVRATMQGPALAHFHRQSEHYPAVQWLGLAVLKSYQDPKNPAIAYVEFIAGYKESRIKKQIHERSAFHQEDGRWYYVDGTHLS